MHPITHPSSLSFSHPITHPSSLPFSHPITHPTLWFAFSHPTPWFAFSHLRLHFSDSGGLNKDEPKSLKVIHCYVKIWASSATVNEGTKEGIGEDKVCVCVALWTFLGGNHFVTYGYCCAESSCVLRICWSRSV